MQRDWPALAASELDLPPGIVRCCRTFADGLDPAAEAHLLQCLDDEERAQAGRFAHTTDRRLYLAAHAALRRLLGRLLGCCPSALRFERGAAGKPRLADGTGLEFSLSHSGGIALIAITPGIPLGIDIERVRPLSDLHGLAERYLHPEERSELAGLGETEAISRFFRCWTRKEAIAKALGVGLGLRFDRCRVSCRPDAPPRVFALDGCNPPPERWSLHDVSPAPGYIAALAVQHPEVSPACLTLAPDA